EWVETAVFVDLGDARTRIGHFIDHYNFQRPHQGLDGLVPADRFFRAAPEVIKTLQARVASNALELARQGAPKAPFYLTGQVGGQPFSVHAEGERVILTRSAGERQEIDLVRPAGEPSGGPAGLPAPVCPQGIVAGGVSEGQGERPGPGRWPVDEGLAELASGTIVRRPIGRREQKTDLRLLEQALGLVGSEGRAIVRFEDQRRAVLLEERGQGSLRHLGRRLVYRQ